jgi:hypothetical protein
VEQEVSGVLIWQDKDRVAHSAQVSHVAVDYGPWLAIHETLESVCLIPSRLKKSGSTLLLV